MKVRSPFKAAQLLGYIATLLAVFTTDGSGGNGPRAQNSIMERIIVARGQGTMEFDWSRIEGSNSISSQNKASFRFDIGPDSFFTFLVLNNKLRSPETGSMTLVLERASDLPEPLRSSATQLSLGQLPTGNPSDLAVRDQKTGLILFNLEGEVHHYDGVNRSVSMKEGRLALSQEFANTLGLPAAGGTIVGRIWFTALTFPIETTVIRDGAVTSAILPPRDLRFPNAITTVPGPDVIVGDLPSMFQFGTSGTQVGLSVGTTACNNGNIALDWVQLPDIHHPAIPQNLYRMSGGAINNERFEQIGQSWAKHAFFAFQEDFCSFGCSATDFSHLGPGCSDTYAASANATQESLGSRAWINPFTGAFSPGAAEHTGHEHSGVTHRILVEASDLDPAENPGATYFAEAQYATSSEYDWCQAHSTQCNMHNNASYRRFNVASGTTFTFSPVGATVRMAPALNAWTGATINPIEPVPGIDGRALIAYKVTNPFPGIWHYEYAISNQNLDRGIQSFTVPLGAGITVSNLGFHAPPNHPGIPGDGTVGNMGFSNTVWAPIQTPGDLTWSSETFAETPTRTHCVGAHSTISVSIPTARPRRPLRRLASSKRGRPSRWPFKRLLQMAPRHRPQHLARRRVPHQRPPPHRRLPRHQRRR